MVHTRDMDAIEIETAVSSEEPSSPEAKRLNTLVAISVALVATFMAICKVKDDNICQGMQQAQADKLDYWAYYQTRNVRYDVAEAAATQLRLARLGKTGDEAAAHDEAIARYTAIAAKQAGEKKTLKAKAEAEEKKYTDLNFRDDQFDLSDALLAIGIALLAITALTALWWLYWLSLVPIVCGVIMGMAGLLCWNIHPDVWIRMLS